MIPLMGGGEGVGTRDPRHGLNIGRAETALLRVLRGESEPSYGATLGSNH